MPARAFYQVYIVAKGDTLSSIARRFGSSVAEIAVASGISDPNKIKVGQAINIPSTAGADPNNLDEVVVNAQRIPPGVSSSPKMDPRTAPTMSAEQYGMAVANNLAAWLQPPRLWITLAVAAGVGYYLLKPARER